MLAAALAMNSGDCHRQHQCHSPHERLQRHQCQQPQLLW
jgi:hypothetical protein